jgi:hypothetical protein
MIGSAGVLDFRARLMRGRTALSTESTPFGLATIRLKLFGVAGTVGRLGAVLAVADSFLAAGSAGFSPPISSCWQACSG